MGGFHFEREYRTPYSECYTIELNEDEVGRVDLHYGTEVVYATLVVSERLTQDEIRQLIGEIDERLVLTSDPLREDFVVTVWVGREEGVYSDEDQEEEEDEEDEEFEGNGYMKD
ncbi:MAG: hypothetical protein NZ695_05545 [Dehalococcoidia bacterium]|jgi:hypothetical protein|nr:hypothetical protein [Dehalococcoidia bacterium]MDW8009189.1 hypothetical protein [Chloroflexota bacterium]